MLEERFLKSRYFSKGTDFSASDFTRPLYQLWVSRHFEIEKKDTISLAAAFGTALHEYLEIPEVGVIKEFSHITEFNGVTIGGTADLLEWNNEEGTWIIGDHKSKNPYSARRFLGFTRPVTKSRKKEEVVAPDQKKEIMQLSIYKWLFDGLFNISSYAKIYIWVAGYMPMYKEMGIPEKKIVNINLHDKEYVEKHINKCIEVVKSETPPENDCNSNHCNYCDYKDVCPFLRSQNKGFKDLTK